MADRNQYFDALRREMVEIVGVHANLSATHTGRGQICGRVLSVMGAVPRHEYVPAQLQAFAYHDTPLPIGFGKTISQPFIVALMTDLLEIEPSNTVLEIGTGLGYQTAILAELAAKVFSVEIVEELAIEACERLTCHDYENVELRIGDGSEGWPEYAPYDRILVSAAAHLVPTRLISQLKAPGRMVIPTGVPDSQQLVVVEKSETGKIAMREIMPVRFTELETTR